MSSRLTDAVRSMPQRDAGLHEWQAWLEAHPWLGWEREPFPGLVDREQGDKWHPVEPWVPHLLDQLPGMEQLSLF